MLHIIISPAYVEGKRLHGRFVATLAGRQLCTSREPLLAASRILLAEGVDPATPIAASCWPDRFRGQHALGDLRALQGLFPCGRRSTGAF